MRQDSARIAAGAGLLVALCAACTLMPAAPSLLAAGGSLHAVLLAPVAAQAALAELAAALLIVALLALGWASTVLLLPLAAVGLAAAAVQLHAEAQPLLIGMIAVHQLGAALSLGGLPAFAAALGRVVDGLGWRPVAGRFGRAALAGLLAALAAGLGLAWTTANGADVGAGGFYASRYGVLLGAKAVLLVALTALLAAILRTANASGGRRQPIARLKRLSATASALGLAAFVLTAALLVAPPPRAAADRVSWSDIVARTRPLVPHIASVAAAPAALESWFGDIQRRAGLAVLVAGLLAALACGGLRLARHWPMLAVALGIAAFARDGPAIAGYRLGAVLVIALGLIEWRARGFRGAWLRAPQLLPLLMGLGGIALLLLAGAGQPPARRALAAFTDAPFAVLLVTAAMLRWQEVRLDPYEGRWAGWLWAGCIVLLGLLLLAYPLA